MYDFVPRKNKEDQLHIRMKPDVKAEFQVLADSKGFTMSSLAHSLIIQAIRAAKNEDPSLFAESERKVNGNIRPSSDSEIKHVAHLGKLSNETVAKRKSIKKKAGGSR